MKRNVAAQKIRRSRTKRQKKKKFILLRRLWTGSVILGLFLMGMLGIFLFSSFQVFWSHMHQSVHKKVGSFLEKNGCRLHKITIEGTSKEIAVSLKKKLGLVRGMSFFDVDPWAVKEALERSPLIHKVLVERRFPNELYIKISQRVPMARWQHNKKIRFIDHQGQVMPSDFKPHTGQGEGKNLTGLPKSLPLFIGKEAPKKGVLFLTKIQNYEEITRQITALNNVSNRRWNIYLNGDLEVRLPEENVEEAIEKLSELEREGLLTVRKIKIIDLRFLPKVIVCPKEGVVLENIFKKPEPKAKASLDLEALSGHKKET